MFNESHEVRSAVGFKVLPENVYQGLSQAVWEQDIETVFSSLQLNNTRGERVVTVSDREEDACT